MTRPPVGGEDIAVATRIIAALTGWRWTWPPRTVQDVYEVPYMCQTLMLQSRPVSAVHSVLDAYGNPIEYELSNGFRLHFPHWWGSSGIWIDSNYPPSAFLWPNMFPRSGYALVTVDYTYGSPPSSDMQRAINQFAQQLAWADAGLSCSLPERVTNVTRQGVSYTLLDPQDFLDNGRTGLYFVDLVIKAYQARKVSVYSPETKPARRLRSVQVPS